MESPIVVSVVNSDTPTQTGETGPQGQTHVIMEFTKQTTTRFQNGGRVVKESHVVLCLEGLKFKVKRFFFNSKFHDS